jgi:hypothetical protein
MRTSILRNLFPPQPHLRLTSPSGDEAALWLSGTMLICVVEWHLFKTRSEQFKARSIRSWRFAVSRRSHCGWNGNPRQRCALARKASADRTRALPGAACGDLKPPVWLGSARAPFSPLWLPLPCFRKRRASALLAPTYRHNKFPTATAFGDSLASSRRTNSRLGQILHSCIIRWRWSSKFSN